MEIIGRFPAIAPVAASAEPEVAAVPEEPAASGSVAGPRPVRRPAVGTRVSGFPARSVAVLTVLAVATWAFALRYDAVRRHRPDPAPTAIWAAQPRGSIAK
jgi:hypothetical protein